MISTVAKRHMLCHNHICLMRSYRIVMKDEVDITRPLGVVPHKVVITLWSLLLGVARKHALQAYAYALDVVDRRPALTVEQVETNDAVRVDVRVPRDWVGVVARECDFRWLCEVRVSPLYG
jgi:hypothetical protein